MQLPPFTLSHLPGAAILAITLFHLMQAFLRSRAHPECERSVVSSVVPGQRVRNGERR